MGIREKIERNPYRVLGVYAGSSPAEESKHKSRIMAFSNVGRTAEFEFPVDGMLSPMERTADMATEAAQILSLPRDRVYNALFWIGNGESRWSRELNSAIEALLNLDFLSAICHYGNLIYNDTLRSEFLEATTHGLATFSQIQLTVMVDDLLADWKPESIAEMFAGLRPDDCRNPLVRYFFTEELIPAFEETLPKQSDFTLSIGEDPDFNESLKRFISVFDARFGFLEKARMIFGNDSLEYKSMAEQTVNNLYECARIFVEDIGNWIWTNDITTMKGGERINWVARATKPLVKSCMAIMEDLWAYVVTKVESLAFTRDSILMTSTKLKELEEEYKNNYTNDNETISKASRKFETRQLARDVVWLVIMTILFLLF